MILDAGSSQSADLSIDGRLPWCFLAFLVCCFMAPGLLVGEEVPRRLVDWAQVLPCVFQKPAGVVLHQQVALGADAVVGDAADPFFLLRQEPICHLLDGQGSDLLAPLALGLELEACRQTLAFRLQQVVGGDTTQRVVMPRLLFLVIKIEIPATPSIPVLEDVAVGGA